MIVGVLLAAGGARRFGSQKLVAPLGGAPLVRHAALSLAGATDRLFVVVGHDAARVCEALEGIHAVVVQNHDWADGLSTSLRRAVEMVPIRADAIVVALGDQPGIDERTVRDLIEHWRTGGKPIVATRYRGERGHPVLFDRSVFSELVELRGDVGARALIARLPDRVAYVDVDAEVPRDVDTPGDLDGLGQ